MKQYRITSQNFVSQGEAGYDDAVMDANDLAQLKKLAGLPGMVNEEAWGMQGAVGGNLNNIPNETATGITSPVGSNVTTREQSRADFLDKYKPRPGSDLWFIINFSRPDLTGGTIADKVEQYFNSHPDERPKQ